MPTTYAHWYFGQQCYQLLPTKYQDFISKHLDLYNLGVHGPDVLFYDLSNNKMAKYGSDIHCEPAKDIFTKLKIAYKKDVRVLSYSLGMLSHFIFDSNAHGYVEARKDVGDITHNFIEAQYDRYLMVKNGLNPRRVDRSETIKPSETASIIISQVFPFEKDSIYKSLKSMKMILWAINSRDELYIEGCKTLMNFFNQKKNKDLFVGFKEENSCKASNLRLEKLQQRALTLYLDNFTNIINYFDDKEELSNFFLNNFCESIEYPNNPVLSYEEELNYKL